VELENKKLRHEIELMDRDQQHRRCPGDPDTATPAPRNRAERAAPCFRPDAHGGQHDAHGRVEVIQRRPRSGPDRVRSDHDLMNNHT
jgi:hypothetical protein